MFTLTGAAVTAQARVNDARRPIGKTVALGTTEFTLRFVGTAWQWVSAEVAARKIELNMVHVRTKDSSAGLDAKEIDLLCGGFASAAGDGDIPGDTSSCHGGARAWCCLPTCRSASCR